MLSSQTWKALQRSKDRIPSGAVVLRLKLFHGFSSEDFAAGLKYRSRVTGQVTGQVTGYRSQVTGHRLQVTGHRSQVTGHKQKYKNIKK